MKKRTAFYRLLTYLRPYKRLLIFSTVCMVLFGASDGVIPFLVKHILDGVFADHNNKLLYALPAVIMVFAVIRALAEFGQQYLTSQIGHSIVKDLRNEINEHLLKLSPSFFISKSSGDLLATLTGDVVLIRSLLSDSVAALLRDAVRMVALVFAAIYLDPTLSIIALVALPVGALPIYKIGRRIRKLSKTGQDAVGALSALLQEMILGHRVVKAFGQEKYERDRFRTQNSNITKIFIKSERARALSGPVNEVLGSICISFIVLYGGHSVISGARSQGDFIAFLLSVFLLYDPFKKLSRLNATVQQGLSAAERVFELLDTKATIVDPLDPVPLSPNNSIEFNKVSVSYDGRVNALKDISLHIPEGKRIALVGLSGAGKSTLVDLIPRFIDPTSGTVLLGGVNISNVRLSDLRSRIAVVGQHTFLFNDTVYNNIAYGNHDASRESIIEAAKSAYAFDFINSMPNGFDTIVGEQGLTLSGGQRQRIAIARAILKDAPILILDEATASLDNQSEREVQYALERLEQGRTSIIIAHRLSTVRAADLIVVLKGGEIVEQGSHEALLKQKGEYLHLHSLQFSERGASDAMVA